MFYFLFCFTHFNIKQFVKQNVMFKQNEVRRLNSSRMWRPGWKRSLSPVLPLSCDETLIRKAACSYQHSLLTELQPRADTQDGVETCRGYSNAAKKKSMRWLKEEVGEGLGVCVTGSCQFNTMSQIQKKTYNCRQLEKKPAWLLHMEHIYVFMRFMLICMKSFKVSMHSGCINIL